MRKVLLGAFLASACLVAGPTIAPLGHNLHLTMASGQRNVVNSGGRFTAYVNSTGFFEGANNPAELNDAVKNNGTAPTNPTTPVQLVPATKINVWCVDYQFQFEDWRAYRTNILYFGEINGETGANRDVRYEDVPNAGPPADFFRWALQGGSGAISLGSGMSEAGFRYRMAAYLIQNGYDDRYAPGDTTSNRNVQTAIWTAMDTNLDTGNQTIPPSAAVLALLKGAADYVKSNYESAEWNRWAVVSAWADTDGITNSGTRVQTFLTEVPEPGFYGVLALALSGLFLRYRKARG